MKVLMPQYIVLQCTDLRRELEVLLEEAHLALNGYIGDKPLDLADAADGLHSALRGLVSWAESALEAEPMEVP
jgi:hypothetical protein